MQHVLTPLEPPYPEEIATLFKSYPQAPDGYILKLFRVFANSVRFATNKGVANLLDEGSPLALREREIVILRVTANTECEYEWGIHVAIFARAAQLTDAQIKATFTGDLDLWDKREATLIACVDALCNAARISGELLTRFQRFWTKEQQLEILALCGHYHLVSYVANTTDLPLEHMAATFPSGLTPSAVTSEKS